MNHILFLRFNLLKELIKNLKRIKLNKKKLRKINIFLDIYICKINYNGI